MKKVLYTIGLALLAMGCTEDFTDWANPFKNDPEAAKSMTMTITPVATIDLATVTTETIQIFSPSIMIDDEAETTYEAKIYGREEGDDATFEVGADGSVAKDVLEQAVYALYGQRPVELAIPMDVSGFVKVGGQTFKAIGSTTLSVIPNAPEIEAAYYLTGSINGWDNSDTTYKLTNDGSDPYENPVFTCRIPAPEDGSNVEFKMTPESGLGGDWSKCLAAGDEGKFKYNNDGGNLVIVADPDALFYDLVFNMLDQTWKATPVGFNEFIYEIGNDSGWSEPHPIHGNGLGQYSAVIYLDGEFKFKPNKDNWDGDWEKVSGDATSGTLTTEGGPNMDGVSAGFYFVEVDLKEMTYKVTPVNSISIIGSVKGSWDTDIDMTYNEIMKCWEARETLSAGEFKFRLNHDWAINWGGSLDDLVQGGDNLQLAADGPYVIRLFLSDEAPAHCTVKEDNGYPDNFFEIGNEGGWSTSHLLLGNGNGQYQGFYYLDGEFKFKPNADNWDNDLEYVSGDATSGSLTDSGGPNCPDPGAGFYQINLDFANMHYSLLKIESISLIGGFNDWSDDLEMTYNKEEGCWQVTTDAVSGEFKFRANHDWGINWGGSVDNLAQNGANLTLDGGTHTFKLYLSYDGAHHVTIE